MEAARRSQTITRAILITLVILSAIAVAPILPTIIRYASTRQIHPHAPDWALFLALSPQIKIHIAGAITAFVIGCVIWALPKGRGPHKLLGWTWVIAMAVTAVSSLFITGLIHNSYSFIHLLSGWVLIALPMGVFAIRNKNVMAHRRQMTGIFVGGLVVAGLFTFIPGRFMFEFFF